MFLVVQSSQIIRTFVIHQINKTMNDSTEITQELLLRNGWELIDENDNKFEMVVVYDTLLHEIIVIACIDGFACFLMHKSDYIGREFTTIGELKAIAKALYKVELTFK